MSHPPFPYRDIAARVACDADCTSGYGPDRSCDCSAAAMRAQLLALEAAPGGAPAVAAPTAVPEEPPVLEAADRDLVLRVIAALRARDANSAIAWLLARCLATVDALTRSVTSLEGAGAATFHFAGERVQLRATDHTAAGFGVIITLHYAGMSLPLGAGATLGDALSNIATASQVADLRAQAAECRTPGAVTERATAAAAASCDCATLRARLAASRSELRAIAALFGIVPCHDDRPATWVDDGTGAGDMSLVALLRPYATRPSAAADIPTTEITTSPTLTEAQERSLRRRLIGDVARVAHYLLGTGCDRLTKPDAARDLRVAVERYNVGAWADDDLRQLLGLAAARR